MEPQSIDERFAELETRTRNELLAAVDRRFDDLATTLRMTIAQSLEAQTSVLEIIRAGVNDLLEYLETRDQLDAVRAQRRVAPTRVAPAAPASDGSVRVMRHRPHNAVHAFVSGSFTK